MKILYIFLSASKSGNSVQSKVKSEIEGLIENGVECSGLFFTTDEVEEIEVESHIKFIQVPKVKSRFFKSTKQKTAYFQTLYGISFEEKQYDFIYFRYPGAHRLLLNFLRSTKIPLFFEHITSEIEEIKLYKIENPPKLNLSSFLSHLEFYFLPLYNEWKYGRLIREKAKFGICNSQDIVDYQKDIYNKYKTLILGDAVNANLFEPKKFFPLEKEFRMLFLKGAGTRADSNGIDRILKGIKEYNGDYKIKFYLFGKNLEHEISLIKLYAIEDSVFIGSYLSSDQIVELSNIVHLGFGRLAIHRKGLKSNSTIKTREYFAIGLPFVFGHHDPDFSDSILAMKYCKQIAGNDEAVNLEDIINWYQSLEEPLKIAVNMHDFALKFLDYRVKMEKLVMYLNKLEHVK